MKKGQISVLIIIGLVLLLIVSIFIYVTQSSKETEFVREFNLPEETIIPDKFQPVQSFVKECLKTTLYHAVTESGKHGGWVSLKDKKIIGSKNINQLFNEMSNIKLGEPVESSRLVEDGYDLPFWSYNKRNSDLDGYDMSFNLIPKLRRNAAYTKRLDLKISDYEDDHSIEAQLDRYIYYNLNDCLNDFNDFKNKGFEITLLETDFRPMVSIHDGFVLVYLDMPIEIDADKINQKIDFFIEELKVDLKGTYEVALDVNKGMINGYPFLADYTMQMIGQNNGLDKELLPPIYATTTNKGPVSWSVKNVAERFKNHLIYYTQLVQLDRTRNFISEEDSTFIQNPQTEVEKNIYEFETADSFSRSFNLLYKNHSNLDANFFYLGWPIYFQINPSMGNAVVIGETYENEIAFNRMSYTIYDFAYSFSYPVVLEVKDQNAFSDFISTSEGFVFTTAYEVNVKDNEVELNNPFNINLGLSLDGDEPVITQICHDEQQIVGPIDIEFYEKSDPRITYDDIEFLYSCDDINNGLSCNKEPTKTSQYFFSSCSGASIKITDERFEPRTYDLGNINFGDVKKFNFSISKLKPIQYEVKKLTKPFVEAILNTSNIALNDESLKNLGKYEYATVSLQRIPDTPFDPQINEYIFIDENSPREMKSDINLTPGWYKIDSLLISTYPVSYNSNFKKKNIDYTRVNITNDFIKQEEEDGSLFMEQIPLGISDIIFKVDSAVHLQDRYITDFVITSLDIAPSDLKGIGEYRELFYRTQSENSLLVQPNVRRR